MLTFKPVTIDSVNDIRPFLPMQNYRTCDFTIGGILMWASFFDYQYCIDDGVLYIRGRAERGSNVEAFAVPIGQQNMGKSLMKLWDYCQSSKIPLVFSSIPESAVPLIRSCFDCSVIKKLDNWSDYLYNYEDLSTYKGRKYSKKRNHVHQFVRNYPQYQFSWIDETNIDKIKAFYSEFEAEVQKDSDLFLNEEQMVSFVLDHYSTLNMIGGFVSVDEKVIGFSIGEIVNDTLFVHIEKALREYNGAYEVLSMLFAKNISNPALKYINREEDVGDLGLRQSKLSYNPVALLDKYLIEVKGIAH